MRMTILAQTTAVMLAVSISTETYAKNDATPVAVVELFTSEGCSSCPPAEALLNQIHRDAVNNDRPIYALAFHVDYWNRLGWPDPYSSAAYSNRQRRYAAAFSSRQIYTPQMIVNGEDGFVGSNRAAANQAISRALKQTVRTQVQFDATSTRNRAGELTGVTVQLDATGITKNDVVHIAIVEDGLKSNVSRGENSGRTLEHDAVVRLFHTVASSNLDKPVEIDWPVAVEPNNAAVICYVQNTDSWRITGAARVLVSKLK